MNIKVGSTKFQSINEVVIPEVYYRRLKCGNEKIDAAFGDGILPGSSITLTARAGMGKTTFVLQLLELLNKSGHRVGYCSSEESVAQLAMTCKRLQVKNIQVCNEAEVDTISKYMEDLDVIVIDSFQGLVKGNKKGRDLEKYCIEKLVVRAKETECAVILICHNTKAGGIKGSSLIIHAVDVNVSIHSIKDADMNARCIRFDKNRFGPATDIECFIEYSGYDFDKEVVVDSDNSDKPSKSDKKKEQRDAILKMNVISLPEVCKVLSIDSTRAGFLLRELCNELKLIKQGRGVDATFVKPSIEVKRGSKK
jgi:predicted ATP-dependent serine protease